MYDRRLAATGAAIALVAAAIIAFVLVTPRIAAGGLAALAQQQLGRAVTVHGATHLVFSPLALRVEEAALSGPKPDDDSFVMARSAIIPVTLGQLFGAAPAAPAITLEGAEFALLVSERGEASWDFAGKAPGAMTITLDQSRFRYFDARNGQSMELSHVDGTLNLRADGGAGFAGSAVINGRLVRIDADLKSLARVNADGSPLELVLSAREGSASFSGRLATAKVLSLAGPVSLSSDDPAAALRLIGLPLPEGSAVGASIAVDGALDSAGRAYAIRNATLSLGAFRAVGDMSVDLRSGLPKLQARLAADTLWLDGFVPAAGATATDWGRRPLPFALLRTFDAELNIGARQLAYGPVAAGPARVIATLAGGKLQATVESQLPGNGTLNLDITADATTLPPAVSLSLAAEDTPVQPLLGALTGASKLTGTGDLVADLSATGTTQEELAGTLKGTARIGIAAGSIQGVDITALFLAAKQKILEGWQAAPGATPFDNLNASATIADGIATIRDARLESPALTVTAEGILDVLRQGIAMAGSGFVNGQPLLPVPVVAKGLWARPQVYPDIPNILTNPEGGFARLQEAAPLQGN
ncbi:AsmA family protein [Aestuariivirga litoralis]|nr:AsmA family protein [Aestuariivirga litoralis]